jgi:hypothetical protein
VTSGHYDTTCRITIVGLTICVLEGTQTGTYVNPISPLTAGRLTLQTSTTIRTTNGSSGTCPLGANHSVHQTEQTLTVTNATGGPSPHLGPIFARTP